MTKAVRVEISKSLLIEMLALQGIVGLDIHYICLDQQRYNDPSLHIIFTGERLDDIFAVEEGERIKDGLVIIHRTERGIYSEVKPINNDPLIIRR